MRDLVILFVHVIATLARLLGPGGIRSVVAESVLLKQQLLILNRSRQRSPNLRSSDRLVAGLCALLMSFEFLRLYPINPKSLARYRESFYPSGSKGDPNDADLLREMVQKHAERLWLWKADTAATRQLQLLVEYRRQSVDEQTRLTNQLTSLLKSYYPLALECAGGLDTLQACDFLQRWPTLKALRKTTPGRLRQFYRRHGCRRTS